MTIERCRAAIATWNPSLRALRLPDDEEPVAHRGPLKDLAISIKDIIDVKGWTITCNHRPFADRRCTGDADVVAKLRKAGAHLIGAATTTEFAYGGLTDQGLYKPARNPWSPDVSPGDSSAGAGAAVAAGMCHAAVATDTSGSVRGPAAFCGILGLKTGHGSVPARGIYPLAPSLDTPGVLARDPAVLGRVASVILERQLSTAPAAPGRIGWLAGFDEEAGAQPVVKAAMKRALDDFRSCGSKVMILDPQHNLATYHAACVVSLLHEAFNTHGRRLRTEADGYDPRTWSRLTLGAFVSTSTYEAAMRLREVLRREIDDLFNEVDILVTAGAAAPPANPKHAAPFGMLRERFLESPFNATGHPAMTMPIGFDGSGLPLSMQLIAPFGAEDILLQVAAQHGQLRSWQETLPLPRGKRPRHFDN